jgi:hypothetical protein
MHRLRVQQQVVLVLGGSDVRQASRRLARRALPQVVAAITSSSPRPPAARQRRGVQPRGALPDRGRQPGDEATQAS